MEKIKLNLIKKEIKNESRWFVETGDGFDGTAQGYGYKTPQAVYRAYTYFKSKDERKAQEQEASKFLQENQDVKKVLEEYLDEDNCFYRLKDGDETSIPDLLEQISDEQPETANKLTQAKSLWRAIMRKYGF
jgi:hypothetical protein